MMTRDYMGNLIGNNYVLFALYTTCLDYLAGMYIYFENLT